MHCACQVLWSLELPLNECFVDDYLGGDIGEFAFPPSLYLFAQGLEVALHSINTYRDAIDQRERLRVFGEYRRKHAGDNVSKMRVP